MPGASVIMIAAILWMSVGTLPTDFAREVTLSSVAASWAYGLTVCAAVVGFHYTACRIAFAQFLDSGTLQPWRIGACTLSLSLVHLAEIMGFGLALWWAATELSFGHLNDSGDPQALVDDLHVSFASYTSLDLGDLAPKAELRLLTGLETLTGLLMIGWSAPD